jgi:hypothetical protein
MLMSSEVDIWIANKPNSDLSDRTQSLGFQIARDQ